MELRHLRYFVAVAEEGHITRAAERLGMQQPPLSQQIKALESELGVLLFRRLPRGVELTGAGQCLLDDTRAIFARLDRACEAVRRAGRGAQGRISVGISSTAQFCELVPRAISAYRETLPLVSVALQEGGTSDLTRQVRDGHLDVAFVREVQSPAEGLSVVHLLDEEMVVALPSRHPLARRRFARGTIPLEMLAGETFVSYRRPEGPGLTDVIVAGCKAAGFLPQFGQEAPRPTTALNFVAAGHGVTIVPAAHRRMHLGGVVYRKLSGAPQMKAPLNLIFRRSYVSPVVRRFLALLWREAPIEAARVA